MARNDKDTEKRVDGEELSTSGRLALPTIYSCMTQTLSTWRDDRRLMCLPEDKLAQKVTRDEDETGSQALTPGQWCLTM